MLTLLMRVDNGTLIVGSSRGQVHLLRELGRSGTSSTLRDRDFLQPEEVPSVRALRAALSEASVPVARRIRLPNRHEDVVAVWAEHTWFVIQKPAPTAPTSAGEAHA